MTPVSEATSNPAGSPTLRDFTVTTSPEAPEEFARFEQLADKLVKVSKEELDEKLAAEKA